MEITRRDLLRSGLVLTAGGLLSFSTPFRRAAWALSTPYLGEVMLFAGDFAPQGWARCDGGLLPISEHDALFSLIGTTYGGNGQTTFGLPDLRGRVPVHQGQGPGLDAKIIGERGGQDKVTLTVDQLPVHTHVAQGNSQAGTQASPASGVWALSSSARAYATPSTADLVPMHGNSLVPAGGSQPHENLMPFLVVTFCIALFGLYPQFD